MGVAVAFNNVLSTFSSPRRRLDERRQFLDMQTFMVHLPEAERRRMTVQTSSARQPLTHYPIALVPGQFQEHYRTFSAAELL